MLTGETDRRILLVVEPGEKGKTIRHNLAKWCLSVVKIAPSGQ
jgi:hypothetical protein